MLNKKDPLIDAIKQVMQNNQADRDAVKAVNEKFGIQDRRVLPHERQGSWDAAYQIVLTEGVEALEEKVHPSKYSEKQKKLAAVGKNVDPDDNPKTIGRADLKAASMGHASHIGMNNEETVDRIDKRDPEQAVNRDDKRDPEQAVNKDDKGPPQGTLNPGISALNKSTSQQVGKPMLGSNSAGQQVGKPIDKPILGRNSAGQQVGKPLTAPETGPNRGLGTKPAAPGSASAKPPLPKLRPAAAKVKAIRKQPIAGAAQRQGVAARPARNSTVLSRVKAIRYRDKNSIVGPGN